MNRNDIFVKPVWTSHFLLLKFFSIVTDTASEEAYEILSNSGGVSSLTYTSNSMLDVVI